MPLTVPSGGLCRPHRPVRRSLAPSFATPKEAEAAPASSGASKAPPPQQQQPAKPSSSSPSSIPKPLRALLEATQAPSAVAARQAAAASARQLAARAGAAAGAAASRGARTVAANVVPAPMKLARALQERRGGGSGVAEKRGGEEEKEEEGGSSGRGGTATSTSASTAATESASSPPRRAALRRPGSPSSRSPSPSSRSPSSSSSPPGSPPGSPPRSAAPPLPTRRRRVLSLGKERSRAPPPPPKIDHGHPVLELVRRRAASGSKPGKRAPGDTARLALVVEGGGMRGAVSGGGLQALHDLGLRDAFDCVYGSSAGAINATYFLSGQRDGVDIYPEHIANDRFCDMRRLKVLNPKSLAAIRKGSGRKGATTSSGSASSTSSMSSSSSLSSGDFSSSSLDGYAEAAAAAAAETAENGAGGAAEEDESEASQPPALDLGFLLDEIMSPSGAAPLRWDAVVQSDVPLKVIASCVDSLAPVVLEGFEDAQDLAACLRASANVPEVAGEPVVHRGRRLVDAAVFEPVPFRAAINDGATHVLALCTRPPPSGAVARLVGGVVERVVKKAVMSPEYMKPVWRREVELVASFGLADFEMLQLGLEDRGAAAATRPEFGGALLYPVFPGPAAQYAPVCTDVPTIRAGIAEGRAVVERLFGPEALKEAEEQRRLEEEEAARERAEAATGAPPSSRPSSSPSAA